MAASGNATSILGVRITGVTGDPTSNLVYASGPTLITPTLGVATATSINKVLITAPASSATLTIANLKGLTVSNTLTLTGTDGATVNFGAGGTMLTTGVTTLSSLASVGTITTGTWNATAISTTKGGTPTGGTVGQVLRKNSSTDYDYSWATVSGSGSGTVTSVAGVFNRTLITGTASINPTVDISPNYVGQTSITTLGTVVSGTWNATTIAAIKGGTGQTTVAAGDILYGSSTNVWSKLAAGTVGQVLVVSGAGVPAWTNPTSGGSVTSVSGVVNRTTITGTPSINPTVDISATYPGQTSITTLGTVATGTWNATAISAIKGGTGFTTYATGDLIYASAINTLAKRAAGTAGQVLTMVGGVPTWSTPGTGGSVTSVTGGTTGLTFTNPNTSAVMTGTLAAASGGTGQTTYVVGDLLQANTTTSLSRLAAVAAGNVLLSGGVGVASSWGKVNLATHVTGNLPAANMPQLAGLSVAGVAGSVAANIAAITASIDGQVLRRSGTGIGFGTINLAAAGTVGSSVLAVTNGGTGQTTYTNGQLLIGNGTGLTKATLTAGGGITITNASGAITIASNYNPSRQTLVDASTITWNAALGEAAVVTLGNTGRALSITNPIAGRSYILEIVQDATGGRTITTWPTGTKWVGGVPTLTTAANAVDIVTFYYNGSGYRALFNGPFV